MIPLLLLLLLLSKRVRSLMWGNNKKGERIKEIVEIGFLNREKDTRSVIQSKSWGGVGFVQS